MTNDKFHLLENKLDTVRFKMVRPGVWPGTGWTKFWRRPLLVWRGTCWKFGQTKFGRPKCEFDFWPLGHEIPRHLLFNIQPTLL